MASSPPASLTWIRSVAGSPVRAGGATLALPQLAARLRGAGQPLQVQVAGRAPSRADAVLDQLRAMGLRLAPPARTYLPEKDDEVLVFFQHGDAAPLLTLRLAAEPPGPPHAWAFAPLQHDGAYVLTGVRHR